jgi:hypothetical protein
MEAPLSLSLSLTHTCRGTHKQTRTCSPEFGLFWSFKLGFFTGSSSNVTTMYWFQGELCVHRWWVCIGVGCIISQNRMYNDVEESLFDDIKHKICV